MFGQDQGGDARDQGRGHGGAGQGEILGIDPVVRAHFIQIGTPDPQGGDLDTGSDQVRLHHSVCRRSPAGKGGDRVVSGVHGFAVVGGSYGDDLGVIAGAGDGSRFRSAVSGGGYDGDTALPSFFDDPTYRIIPVGTAGRAAEGEGNDSDVVLIAMVDRKSTRLNSSHVK